MKRLNLGSYFHTIRAIFCERSDIRNLSYFTRRQ